MCKGESRIAAAMLWNIKRIVGFDSISRNLAMGKAGTYYVKKEHIAYDSRRGMSQE